MVETSLRDWAVVYCKGLFMGAADSVPGVSGGTIAFITGIYERLIRAITALDPLILTHLFRAHTADGRARFLDDLREMDFAFLVVLGLGAVSAVVIVSRLVQASLAAARAPTYAFFFGLIAASAVLLADDVRLDTPGRVLVAATGFVIAFVVSGIQQGSGLPHTAAFVALAGSIAISAMILPGISGAFLLILLGQYEFLTAILTRFTDGLVGLLDGGSVTVLVETGGTIVAFGVGAVIGLLTIAHVIRRSLDAYRQATLVFLVSLMVGALRLPVEEISASVATWTPTAVAATIGGALGGGVLVFLLDRYTDDLEYA